MTYRSRKTASQQLTGIGFVVGLHLVGIYVVASGLAHQAVDTMMGPIETKVIEEAKPKQEELPPPPPKLQTPPPYVPPPDLDIALEVQQAPSESRAIASVTSNKAAPVAAAPPAPDVEARFDPRGRYNAFPDSEYPSQSRRLGQEGQVTLGIFVQADNSVTEVKVVQSSGFELLDNAAADWYRKRGRFIAASKEGKPIGAWKTLVVTFKLKK